MFTRVLVSVRKQGIKEMTIESKQCLIDEEVYILAEKMFPNWIGFNKETGDVILKDGVESFSMCKW